MFVSSRLISLDAHYKHNSYFSNQRWLRNTAINPKNSVIKKARVIAERRLCRDLMSATIISLN